jgi:hypothetical protein
MKNLLINKDIYLINIIALIIGSIIYKFFNGNIEILGALMATGISISFGVRQYKMTKYSKSFSKSLITDMTQCLMIF